MKSLKVLAILIPVVFFTSCSKNQNLPPYVDAYMQLKNALVADDVKKAEEKAANMKNEMSKANIADKSVADSIINLLTGINASDNIEVQRKSFSDISQQLIPLIKNNSLVNTSLYVDYCPMALNSEGAYWLSDKEKISNPYMGKKMPDCGQVKEIISK